MLGRGYREFTQHFPQPGWVEHDPEEIFRVSLEAIARGAGRRRRAARRASASPTSGRPWCSGTARTLAPVAPRHRLAGPAHQRALPRARGSGRRAAAPRAHRPGRRSLLLRDQARVAAAGPGASAPGRAGRARRGHGRELAGRAAHRRPGPRDRSHQRLPHAALRPRATATGIPSCSGSSAMPRELLPAIVPSAGVVGESDAGALRLRAADRRARRRPAGGALRPGLLPRRARRRTPTAPARSCWSTAATGCPQPPDGRARHRGVRSRRRARVRARGERLHRRRRGAVAARRAGHHRHGGRDRSARPERAGHRRRALRARVRRARHAALGAGGAGDDHRHHPRAPPGPTWSAPRSRRWRSAAPSCSRRWPGPSGVRGAGAPGGRRRGRQRLADAVPGRRPGRPGRAARHGGDDRARRRRARRPRARRLAEQRRVPGRPAVHPVRAADERRRAAPPAGRVGSARWTRRWPGPAGSRPGP